MGYVCDDAPRGVGGGGVRDRVRNGSREVALLADHIAVDVCCQNSLLFMTKLLWLT